MSVLDVSAYIGLIAVGFATANILIGLMIFGRYSPVRCWPHRRRFDVFRIHRWTGYATLAFTLLHPLPLLLNSRPAFRLLDIAFPVWSPLQPFENTLGAAALYLFVIVIITSLYRIQLGRHLWKLFHYLTYAAAAGLFVHGILTDPNLTGNPVDYLDGGKIFVEVCLLLIISGAIWRVRHARQKCLAAALSSASAQASSGSRIASYSRTSD